MKFAVFLRKYLFSNWGIFSTLGNSLYAMESHIILNICMVIKNFSKFITHLLSKQLFLHLIPPYFRGDTSFIAREVSS